jgi:hypothetical protein
MTSPDPSEIKNVIAQLVMVYIGSTVDLDPTLSVDERLLLEGATNQSDREFIMAKGGAQNVEAALRYTTENELAKAEEVHDLYMEHVDYRKARFFFLEEQEKGASSARDYLADGNCFLLQNGLWTTTDTYASIRSDHKGHDLKHFKITVFLKEKPGEK